MPSLDFSLYPEPSTPPGIYSEVPTDLNRQLESVCLLCVATVDLPQIKMGNAA